MERTLLMVDSEEFPAQSALTHLHVVGVVDGSSDAPEILLAPVTGLPWIKLNPESPPLHEKSFIIDVSEFLTEFGEEDVLIGVKAYHWPDPSETRQEVAGGQLWIPHGFTGTLPIKLTADGLATVPVAGCIPEETEACDGVDNNCNGDIDEGFDLVTEVCDGVDNDCDGETDEEPPPPPCDEAIPCTCDDEIPCPSTLCDDGIPCTVDACDPGAKACVSAAPEDGQSCNDGDPCTVDSCDPSIGCRSIIDTLVCKGCETDAGCENDNKCVKVSCKACSGASCPPGFPARCEASNLDNADCSDDDLCTQGDTCQGGACVAGVAKLCVDGIPCTTASCSPETGECNFTPTDSLCDDGVECTENVCSMEMGDCSFPLGDACACKTAEDCPDDGNSCTSTDCIIGNCVATMKSTDVFCVLPGEVCVNEASCNGQGSCVADKIMPPGSGCDDGDACTTNDSCSGAGVCQGTIPEEICNGVDDNCNDQVDEGIDTVGEACDGEDLDQCKHGTFGCTEDGLIVCQGDDFNSIEVLCDGLDEDCDGLIDETFTAKGKPCEEDGSLEADTGCSVWACDPNDSTELICGPPGGLSGAGDKANPVPVGSPELCNGIDDNCNGQIDEDLAEDPEIGQSCGQGECLGGTKECSASGQVVCSTNTLQQQEVDLGCNGKDDDCDGQIDEHAQDEWCNDKDDDCDGLTDEGEGVQNACGGCGLVPKEICNGEDEDCDGQIDEDEVCGQQVTCIIKLVIDDSLGGKGDGEGPDDPPVEEMQIFSIISGHGGDCWATAYDPGQPADLSGDPGGDLSSVEKLLRFNALSSPEGGSPFEPLKVVDSPGYLDPIAISNGLGGDVIVAYNNSFQTIHLYDTVNDAWSDPVYVYDPSIGWVDTLVPLYLDGGYQRLLIHGEGKVRGASIPPSPPGMGYLWDEANSAPFWQEEDIITVAWTGNELLALTQTHLLICSPASLANDALPPITDCKERELPIPNVMNTIVTNPNTWGNPDQWVLVANVQDYDNDPNIFRTSTASGATAGGLWLKMPLPDPLATIDDLKVSGKFGWLLGTGPMEFVHKLSVFDLDTLTMVSEYILDETPLMSLAPDKQSAYAQIPGPAGLGLGHLTLECASNK